MMGISSLGIIAQQMVMSLNEAVLSEIQYVGGKSGEGTFYGTSPYLVTFDNLTGGLQSSPNVGDVFILVVAASASSTALCDGVGIRGVVDAEIVVETVSLSARIIYGVYQSGSVSGLEFSPPAGNVIWFLSVYRGVDLDSPLDITPPDKLSAINNNSPDYPLILPINDKARIITVGLASATGGVDLTAPSGTTLLAARRATGGGSSFAGVVADRVWNSSDGAFDPPGFSGTNSSDSASVGFTIALRPAGAPERNNVNVTSVKSYAVFNFNAGNYVSTLKSYAVLNLITTNRVYSLKTYVILKAI